MGLRELLILLLGLAIVAVILRGLYVALQARRGQIRLAIDKNIPQDVDLEALEMAELPGGGARVVSRGGEADEEGDEERADYIPEDPIAEANARAESIALGREDEAVPVLMDSVQVGSSSANNAEDEGELEGEEDEGDEIWQEKESWRAEPRITDLDSSLSEDETGDDEIADDGNADDVLLDYQTDDAAIADDGMSAVQPDYPEEDTEDDLDAEQQGQGFDADNYSRTEDDWQGESAAEYEDYDEAGEGDDAELVGVSDRHAQSRLEPSFNPDGLGEDLEGFSMTAGERIGGNPQVDELGQTSMFAADDEQTESPPVRRKSLFAALSGRIRSQMANLRDTSQDDAHLPEELDSAQEQELYTDMPEPELPDSIPMEQLDIESSLDDEPEPEPAELQQPEPRTREFRTQNTGSQRTEVKQQEASGQSSEVLVLNVMAQEGREFRGEDLMHTIITSGMKFGEMQIFHHRFGNGSSGPVIFSLANILNPGTFDLNNMSQFRTIGVSLFLAMPTPINNLDAFEQMLAVARQLCTTLDGELKDDHRNVMTAQTIEHYRQRIRDFELRQLKTAGSRG